MKFIDKIKNLFSKKFKFYLVCEADNDESIVCVCSTVNEIGEFINSKILVDHFDHYKSWCELKNIDFNDITSKRTYLINYFNNSSEETLDKYNYIIKKINYDKNTVAAVLRILHGYVPLGCSYETPEEVQTELDIVAEREKLGLTGEEEEISKKNE